MKKREIPSSQKGLALFLTFFLIFLYKETVWDVYFAQDKALEQTSEIGTEVATAEAKKETAADAPEAKEEKSYEFREDAEPVVAKPQPTAAKEIAAPVAKPGVGHPTDSLVKQSGEFVIETNTVSGVGGPRQFSYWV